MALPRGRESNLVPRSQSVRGCRNVTVGDLGTRSGRERTLGTRLKLWKRSSLRASSLLGQPRTDKALIARAPSEASREKIGGFPRPPLAPQIQVSRETPIRSRDGAVVRALASHQCGPGSIPGLGVICGLSLLLVLVPAPRVFLRVLRFSSLHKN